MHYWLSPPTCLLTSLRLCSPTVTYTSPTTGHTYYLRDNYNSWYYMYGAADHCTYVNQGPTGANQFRDGSYTLVHW